MSRPLKTALAACAIGTPCLSQACWGEAERLYGVSSSLLYAVARAESDLDPSAVNLTHQSRTGTYDIGLMQINSSHLPMLARHGITEAQLYEPCTSMQVGAWLLAHSFARHGATWNAVGAYNAACSQLKGAACTEARARFAWKVYRRLPATTSPLGGPSMTLEPRQPLPGAVTPPLMAARVSP